MDTLEAWKIANRGEVEWWKDCTNTHDEEMKQEIFAQHMGIEDEYRLKGSG